MGMRGIIAFAGAIVLSIFAVMGMRFSGGVGADVYEGGDAEIALPRNVPRIVADPMEAVGSSEASRRATLHSQAAEEVMQASANKGDAPGFVAAPVIEQIFMAGSENDPFKSDVYIPPPEEPEAAPLPDPEPDPEPEPAKAAPKPRAVEAQAVVDPRLLDWIRKGYQVPRPTASMTYSAPAGETAKPGFQSSSPSVLTYDNPVGGTGTSQANEEQSSVFDLLDRDTLRFTQAIFGDVPPAFSGSTSFVGTSYRVAQLESDAINSTNEFVESRFDGPDNSATYPLERTPEGLRVAKPGDLFFATLDFGFNSDDPQGLPIFGTITDMRSDGTIGPLHNARIQGGISYSESQASIRFSRIITERGLTIPADAVAVGEATARTGVADRVDRHRLERYAALFFGGLIKGIGDVGTAIIAGRTTPQTVVVVPSGDINGDGTLTIENDFDIEGREAVAAALKPVGDAAAQEASRGFNRPPTISAPAGMGFAVIFTEPLVIPYDALRN